jgi:S1-C subfamily serine protease
VYNLIALAFMWFSGYEKQLAQRIVIPPDDRIVLLNTSTHACSGFVVAKGFIMTAGHCATKSENVQNVYFADGRIAHYDIVYDVFISDCAHDWALLKTDTSNIRPLKVAEADAQPFNEVIHIGHPLGMSKTYVHKTYVLQLNKDMEFLEIFGSAIPGESGSALLNMKGEIAGVVVCTDPIFDIATVTPVAYFREYIKLVSGL